MADITKILLRRDYLSNWESENPVLGLGEPCVAISNTDEIIGFKIGDGHTNWVDLDWQTGDLSSVVNTVTTLQSQVESLNETIYDETNGLDTRVSTLESDVYDEETGLSVLAETVSTNTTNIGDLQLEKEDVSNKVTSLSNQSTDEQYASAKCVYEAVEDVQDNVRAEANARNGQDMLLDNRITGLETKVPNPPSVSGTYTLKCDVDIELGTIVYEWVEEL